MERQQSLKRSSTATTRRWKIMQYIAACLGLISLAVASFVCLLVALRFKASIQNSGCPVESIYYLYASGILYALWMIVGLVGLLTSFKSVVTLGMALNLCLVSIVAAILGAVASAKQGCSYRAPEVFTLIVISVSLFIIVCVPLACFLLHIAIRSVSPSDPPKSSTVLVFLRCSCISPGARRSLFTLPFIVAMIVCLVFQSTYCNDVCTYPFQLYLALSAVLFGTVVCLSSWCSIKQMSISRATMLPYYLVTLGILHISWGIVGAFWIHHGLSKTTCSPHLFEAARHISAWLVVFGILLTGLTSCCKLERVCLPLQIPPSTSPTSQMQVV